MNKDRRIDAFSKLGEVFNLLSSKSTWSGFDLGLTESEYNEVLEMLPRVKTLNQWFTEENVLSAFKGLSIMLEKPALTEWTKNIPEENTNPKKIGVIMAGNIPLVGFHDALSVLITGNKLVFKASSQDNILPLLIFKLLKSIDHNFENYIQQVQKLENIDAIIATGSDNSSRYFESYFGKYPNIIRKNRTSVAVFDATETEEELKNFADDVFQYFGLGCRNVSKVFVPRGYDLNQIFKGLFHKKDIVNHNKYANNYDYNKAVYLMNKIELIENGFILFKEDKELVSPVGVLFYDYYDDISEVNRFIDSNIEKIQCVVGHQYIPFGEAQKPKLWDYADNIDTLKFIQSIS